jgi:hypothetical protein
MEFIGLMPIQFHLENCFKKIKITTIMEKDSQQSFKII